MTDPNHERLRNLFDRALQLPAAARSAFLDSQCGGDIGLKNRLLAMLAAAADEHFLAEPTGDGVAASAAAIGEGPGARIGPYKLLQQIGEGGFGVVFMAEQEQPVVRKVALKIIKLGMDTRQVVARFEQERQALAIMDHANIARVLDAGATATGRPYFVMELVKGSPIVEYCDKNNLTIDERLDLFAQVCSAVQHAHGKGIIHRDLKPSNILVGTQDGRPQPKVIDFGIAKATLQKLTDKTLFTEHHQVIGTLQYMSPEQAEGSLDIDTRTDVYSLGILLYELLTGSTPFDKKTLQDAMYGEIRRMIREVEPPRPSTRLSESQNTLASIAAHRRIEPRRLGLLLRGELDWIVMKALEKDRARRYETANGLMMDVRRYLAGDAVVAAPPSGGYRLRKFVQRNRATVSAAAAVAVALLLGVVAFAWQASVAAEQRDRATMLQKSEGKAKIAAQENEQTAILQARRAETAQQAEAKARARAETISDFVIAALQASDAQNAGGREDMTILAAMDTAIADIASGRFKDDPETEAELKNTIATILRNHGRADTAHSLAVQALEIHQRLHPGDHPDVAAGLNDVARSLGSLGRLAEAEPLMVRSLEMYQRLYQGDNKHIAALLNNVADLREDLGRPKEAEPLMEQALAMHQRLHPGDDPSLARCMDNLAGVRSALGRFEQAEPLYDEALAMRQRLYPGDHPDLAVGLNNLAFVRVQLGRREEAEPLFVQALAMRRRLFQGDHPDVAQALTNLGFLRNDLGRPEEAEPLITEALAMNRRLYPGDHHATAHCLFTLALLRITMDQPAAAEPVCIEALAMHQRLFPGDHMGVAISLANLARVRHSLHKEVEARQSFDAAVAMLRRLPDGATPLLDILGRSAAARLDLKDDAGALPELEEVVAMAEQRLPPDSQRRKAYREALDRCKAALEAGKGK